MNKKVIEWHGHKMFLLGQDIHGVNHWLVEPSWDCGWYWGLGYVETLTNQRQPQRSKDILSHRHWDGLFPVKWSIWSDFKELLPSTPLDHDEVWMLSEFMEELYTLRKYSDFLHRRGSHVTHIPDDLKEVLRNDAEYDRINKEVIPAVWKHVVEILSPGGCDE